MSNYLVILKSTIIKGFSKNNDSKLKKSVGKNKRAYCESLIQEVHDQTKTLSSNKTSGKSYVDIHIHIEMGGEPAFEKIERLRELLAILQNELEIPWNLEMANNPMDIPTGAQVGALATVIKSISFPSLFVHLVNLLKGYMEQKRCNTLTITGEGYRWNLSNLSHTDADRIIQELREKNLKNIIIKIDD